VTSLPKTGPVETYAQMRAALDKAAFLDALPGLAVFVRLDERGGDDEPAPWAFHGSGLPLPVDVPSSEQHDDVFVDRADADRESTASGAHKVIGAAADDSTLTGPTFSLSIPAARGRATLLVIPHASVVTVGRDAKCGVRVNERSVSREHARIVMEEPTVRGSIGVRGGPGALAGAGGLANKNVGRTFAIADAGGDNGIAVNGKAIARGAAHKLASGDVVDLGDVSLLFLDAAELYDGLPRLTSG
jgi:pSer/pThr/pTyr-binding forkhead associated (FHA) protein